MKGVVALLDRLDGGKEAIESKGYIFKTIFTLNKRQTIRQLSEKYDKGKDWIRDRIRNAPAKEHHHSPQPVVVIADVTFFKRSFGILVIRAPHLKKNLYVHEVKSESVDAYWQGRRTLENMGYTMRAIVLDGRPGVRQLFSDIPVQMCHFHQKQIITRYLTNNPKLEAGIELKKLVTVLCETTGQDFTAALDAWYGTWSSRYKNEVERRWVIGVSSFRRRPGVFTCEAKSGTNIFIYLKP